MKRNLLAIGVVVLATAVLAQHGEKKDEAGHAMFTLDELKWTAGPKSLPAGTLMAVLEGDPAKAGLFTIRVKVPGNYTVPPHWHPADEHVTVISGVFYMAAMTSIDKGKAKALPTGSFSLMFAKQAHFAFTRDEGAVIQLHGVGPWQVNYLNPADDPRKQGNQPGSPSRSK